MSVFDVFGFSQRTNVINPPLKPSKSKKAPVIVSNTATQTTLPQKEGYVYTPLFFPTNVKFLSLADETPAGTATIYTVPKGSNAIITFCSLNTRGIANTIFSLNLVRSGQVLSLFRVTYAPASDSTYQFSPTMPVLLREGESLRVDDFSAGKFYNVFLYEMVI